MTTTHRNFAAEMLAVFGVLLPYAVAILPSVLFSEKIHSVDFYDSGRLTTFDNVTGWLTIGAFVFGLALCCPWLKTQLVDLPSQKLWIALVVPGFLVHFVTVFVIRFLVYVKMGGIL